MLYLITNIAAWVVIAILFLLSMLIDRKGWKEYYINDIVLIALLVSVSVILTNVISYKFIVFSSQIKLALGASIIFISGMLFGPYYGVLTGLIADTCGLVVGIAGPYSALFTLDSVLYGFVGSLVWLGGINKWWIVKTIFYYALTLFIVSFGIDLLYIYVAFGTAGLVSDLVIKGIKFGPELLIYLIVTMVGFSTIYQLMINRSYHEIWVSCKTTNIKLFKLSNFLNKLKGRGLHYEQKV